MRKRMKSRSQKLYPIPVDIATAQEIRDIKNGRKQHERGQYRMLSDVLHEMDHNQSAENPPPRR